MVRAAGGAIVNELGGGIMVRGDPPPDPCGEGRMFPRLSCDDAMIMVLEAQESMQW